MPAISVLMKPSSGMCNMNCDYCFYCDEAAKRQQESYGFMSEATLKNVIRKTMTKADGAISYAYQGGEPTLRGLDFFKQALAYQRQYNRRGLQVANALQTNGYAIDGEWCRFFADNHFLIGVSLDGTKAIHDAHRHAHDGGSWERVMHSIALMEEHGVAYNILTVVNRDVARSAAEIYEFYRRQGFAYQQYIPCLDPLGEPRGKNGYALRPEEYGRFLITLFFLWHEDWTKGRQPYIRQFDNYIGILAGYPPEACDMRGCCGIQTVVEADGSAYPCDFYMLDEYRLGNFNENRLDDMDRRRKEIGFVERSAKLDASCRSCPYHFICRGGCFRNRDYLETSDTYRNYFCESYRMFFDACLDSMRQIADTLR